jgi:AraC-like DNA-binding protein
MTDVAVQELVGGRPAPALRPFIRGYTGYVYAGLAPGIHYGLPSGGITFEVSLEDPIDIVSMPGSQSAGAFDAFVGGLHVQPAGIAHDGHGAGISVDLSPVGCRSLFGMPAAALFGSVVDLRDVFAAAGVELAERARSAGSWPERFAVFDDVLGRVLADCPLPSVEVLEAWDRLVASGGRVPVHDLAASIGWSRRHLSHQFGAEFGMSPKSAARVLRFERTCDLLGSGMPIADAAAAGGYFDQAHLTNDWKRLAGVTPTVWLGDQLRHHHDDADQAG